MKLLSSLIIAFVCASSALAKTDIKKNSATAEEKTNSPSTSLRSAGDVVETASTSKVDSEVSQTTTTTAVITKSSGSDTEGFLSNLFSLAGIGSKNVATTERFDSEDEHSGTNETTTEGEHGHGHGMPYFVMWRYLQDADCTDGSSGGDYMTAFAGKTNECKYINDLKHGTVKCSEDGTTYTAEYYADDKCHDHTATFVTDEPTNVCHKINGNVWKTICAKEDLSSENPYMNCFAGSEMVYLESGESIRMEDVKLGDRIQVASYEGEEFADVVYLPHDYNKVESTFVRIESVGGNSIRMTPDHLILAGECNALLSLTPAKAVNVGQCVESVNGQEMVIEVAEDRGQGVYTVVTSQRDGIIIVNGYKASSFATNHYIVNGYYDIHRALYKYGLRFTALNSIPYYFSIFFRGVLSA